MNWRFVIRGAIDGFCRLVVFLRCSTNNNSSAVKNLFLSWRLMEEERGPNRWSYIAASSVHNQRIERLWRDVFCNVCHTFYYTFQTMESFGLFQPGSSSHMLILHYVFLPRISKAIESFVQAWNHHPMRTGRNLSPIQISTNGMVHIRHRSRTGSV